jgi:hypothetical protein
MALAAAGCTGGDSPKRVFVTTARFAGDFGGLAAADQQCNDIASSAIAAGFLRDGNSTWRAWLSDSTTDAIDRIDDVGPWYLVDDSSEVFRNKAHLRLMPADLLVPIHLTERGEEVEGAAGGMYCEPLVWTGTASGGTKSPLTCADWTSADSQMDGTRGVPAQDDRWTDEVLYCGGALQECNFQNHLYCFEQ